MSAAWIAASAMSSSLDGESIRQSVTPRLGADVTMLVSFSGIASITVGLLVPRAECQSVAECWGSRSTIRTVSPSSSPHTPRLVAIVDLPLPPFCWTNDQMRMVSNLPPPHHMTCVISYDTLTYFLSRDSLQFLRKPNDLSSWNCPRRKSKQS